MEDLRYLTDFYDEKIKKINDLNAPINFVFITDMHHKLNKFAIEAGLSKMTSWEDGVKHVKSIQYIIDRVPGIQFVLSGGDIGCDYHTDPNEVKRLHHEIMDALYSLSVPVHCVIGNHDDALGDAMDRKCDNTLAAIPPEELHKLCMRNNPTDKNYYYMDLADTDYRFVFLDVNDKPYHKLPNGQYPFGWRVEFSNEQADWFEKEALATDKNVIVVCHCPIRNNGIIGSGDAPSYIRSYDDVLNAPRVYSAIKSSKNVLCILAGHVHFDNFVYDDGLPVITTLCSYVQKWSALCPDREVGTITETAFDVVSIKENKIYLTRFGAGEDREGILPMNRG